MRTLKYLVLATAVAAFPIDASAQNDGCGYGCNYKITYYSDSSLTVKVGRELSLCSDPDNPIVTGTVTDYSTQATGWCD